MMELRAPKRTPPPAYRPRQRSDDSGEMLLVIIAILVSAVVGLALYINSQKANAPAPTISTALDSTAIAPVTSSAVPPRPIDPQPVYRQPQASATPGPTPEQIRRYNAMQENCYRVTRMNSNGDYPALQTSACNDYARYANSIGLNPGQLPDVLVAQAASPVPSYAQSSQGARTPPAVCTSLEQSKQRINTITRQALTAPETEYYREELRKINSRMWDLNCRNH